MGFDQLKANLRGVAFTNPTPFSADGADVRHDALAENTRHVVDAGGRVLIPCGNTGEYYSLTDDERVAVVSTTATAAGEDASIVAGAGGSTKEAIALADAYEDAGADAIMVMHPVHTYQHEAGLREYYRAIVDATDLPVVVYKRGPEVTADLIRELAAHERVVGVKYAEDDVAAFANLVASVDADVVWSNGIAERYAPSFAIEGAEGFTTGIGNFLPGEVLALMDAIRREDWARARELRDLLAPYERLRQGTGPDNEIRAANNVPGVKRGMELAGLYGGPVREPLASLSAADAERAEQYYEAAKAEAGIDRSVV
ncbi:dihydrodipicolinate synthase family protein [Halorarum salinum]|uniref:Dihydrodipicolinate synthase family protein n=1 Tax=Halorarum salinum TaxID=2743089 RepID=A0A7D5L9W3_9EURY|nr:dihydrodipicolinate synthase family protein [Halobaculum salinum]QLG61746.1 dihydrodipicolinate synthase family protein [Halobaculum salinum]